MLKLLGSADAHMISLQEVVNPRRNSALRKWSRELDMEFAFAECKKLNGQPYGNAILSKLPILNRRHLSLPTSSTAEARSMLGVQVEVGHRSLSFWATHFGLFPPEQFRQARVTIQTLRQDPNAIKILAGDLNLWWRRSRAGLALEDYFGDLSRVATFPARWPALHLDHLLAKPGKLLRSVRPLQSADTQTMSDHLPLVATVDLSGPTSTTSYS